VLPLAGVPAAVDVDQDGDVDLVSSAGGATIYFQEAPGSFGDPLALLVSDAQGALATADLDQDGDVDIVSADRSHLLIFFQEAPGSFASEPLALALPGTTDLPRFIAAADLDLDGAMDLVSANHGNSNLTVFFQDDGGTFARPRVLGGFNHTPDPVCVTAADLDQDGDLDIASANLDGTVSVFFRGHRGGSRPLHSCSIPRTRSIPITCRAGRGPDSDVDLVCANEGSGNLSVFSQGAPGVFSRALVDLGIAYPTCLPRETSTRTRHGSRLRP
jgi:hypothetical protein